MTRRLVGALVGAAFALGFLSGAAGTIVAHDDTRTHDFATPMVEHMAGYDMGSMMSGAVRCPDSSSIAGSEHERHHPGSPDGAQ